MERKYQSNEQALSVAKEALWLAWNACGGPAGMGFMQDKPGADKDAVWKQTVTRGDYSGVGTEDKSRIDADYVFGRMMKLRFSVKDNAVNVPENTPHPAYQGWCNRYKTYADLFNAAEMEIGTRHD